jgi:ADP-glucose pyrophosphorylase
VAQNIDIVDSYGIKYVIVLAGDHIYKMDYEIMLQQHVDHRRRCDHRLPDRAAAEATPFGVMHVDKEMRITDPSWKSRKTRRAFRAIPIMRWPRWGSMSSTGPSCAIC